MKKLIITTCILFICCAFHMKSQTAEETSVEPQTTTEAKPVYGTLRYDSILHAMPEYAAMKIRVQQLRKKYEAEAQYNEQNFKRLFEEFMQGQKDFPQNILLKRQHDLQEQLEKGLAFRHEADSIVCAAEAAMLEPIRLMLDDAIAAVGEERGYHLIINRDNAACPFVRRSMTEDATPHVLVKLKALR